MLYISSKSTCPSTGGERNILCVCFPFPISCRPFLFSAAPFPYNITTVTLKIKNYINYSKYFNLAILVVGKVHRPNL